MVKREEVEALMADMRAYTGRRSGIVTELCHLWLAVDAAPVGHLRDSIDFDGDTGMDESQARALIGQRVNLVPVTEAGGGEG